MFDGLDDAYPLTPLQQGILYETLKAPDTDIYVAYILIDIVGAVDRDSLFSAWEKTCSEFATLRTRFLWEELDEPLQLVNTAVNLCWHDVPLAVHGDDASGDEAVAHSERLIEHALAVERQTPLSVSDAPPMRFRLVQVADEHQVLIWTIHHLLADDWSTPLVLQRVAYHLQTRVTETRTESLAFGQYVVWLNDTDRTSALTWWREHLKNAAPTPINVESGLLNVEVSNTQAHQRIEQSVGADVSRAIYTIAQSTGTTISVIAHAAWALVVSRYAGTADALFGTSVSGRSSGLPGITDAVGLFLNTLPTYIALDGKESVADYLERVRAQLFEQIRYEHVPLTALTELVGPKANDSAATDADINHSRSATTSAGTFEVGQALFDSVLVVEAHGRDLSITIPDNSAAFQNIRYITDSNYPLSVLVFPGDILQLQLIAPGDQFPLAVLSAMANELTDVLGDLCQGGTQTVAELRQKQERRMRALYPYKALPEKFIRTPPCVHIDEWIAGHAQTQSQQIAVVDLHRSYQYDELLMRAHRLANVLYAINATAYVGLCLERGVEQIVAILGVLISRCAYVPIDPRWPVERRTHVINDAHIDVIVTTKGVSRNISGTSCTVICLDELENDNTSNIICKHAVSDSVSDAGNGFNADDNANNNTDARDAQTIGSRRVNDPAYMIYTSGSTGKPKGVPISHANLLYSTTARIAHYIRSPGCFLLLSPYSFDSSVAGIFWTLCHGGALVLSDKDGAQDIHDIVEQIHRHQVTHTLCLPSVYALILRFGIAEKLKSLQCVIVAGESCPPTLLAKHQGILPGTALYNEYGPTEGTVWSTVAQLFSPTDYSDTPCESSDAYHAVAIGQAIPGTQVRVVDSQSRTLPRGVAGELQIIGPGVAAAYHGDEPLSQQRFKLNDITLDRTEDAGPANRSKTARAYCTGDMAFLGVDDDQLYFLGRIDRQIKIRGHRIEPAEIESRLLLDERVDEAFCCLMSPDQHLTNSPSGSAASNTAKNNAAKNNAGKNDAVKTEAGKHQESSAPGQLCCFYSLRDQHCQEGSGRLLTDEKLAALCADIETSAAQSISATLPVHFTVARFAPVTALPTLSNGKVDILYLTGLLREEKKNSAEHLDGAESQSTIYDAQTVQGVSTLSQAMSMTLTTLCETLASMIGRSSIQPSDNYFSLGGDSLTAIRFVAACREKGLPLTIPMIGMYANLAELGEALDQSNQSEIIAASVDDYGPTPLTAIQSWFFASMSDNAAHWNMAFTLKFADPVNADQLQNELLDLINAHRVLATRFISTDEGISALIPQEPDNSKCLRVLPDKGITLAEHLQALQNEFSLEAGQLLRVSLQNDTDNRCHQIGVVVHHLVTDAISNWLLAQQLLERLDQSSLNLSRQDTRTGLTSSYRQWALSVATHGVGKADNDTIRPSTETKFVDTVHEKTLELSDWREANVQMVNLTIDTSEFNQLNRQAKASGGEIHEWLLYLLVKSLPAVSSISLDVETHGRDSEHGVDNSTSIGWFTDFFRLDINKPDTQIFAQFVQQFRHEKAMKASAFSQHRLEYISHTASGTQALPVLLYNFLAMTSFNRNEAPSLLSNQFQPLLEPGFRHSQCRRSHAIELIVSDALEGLSVQWRIDATVAKQWDFSAWRDRFRESLVSDAEARGLETELVVSEAFPDSGLSDDEVDDFLTSLE